MHPVDAGATFAEFQAMEKRLEELEVENQHLREAVSGAQAKVLGQEVAALELKQLQRECRELLADLQEMDFSPEALGRLLADKQVFPHDPGAEKGQQALRQEYKHLRLRLDKSVQVFKSLRQSWAAARLHTRGQPWAETLNNLLTPME